MTLLGGMKQREVITTDSTQENTEANCKNAR